MNDETRRKITDIFREIEELTSSAQSILTDHCEHGEGEWDLAAEDAMDYTWRIRDECQEAQGQFWAL
jgi:ElaB/YqjD/DUF883 family membrane-anchored ribosome-binding protein